MTVAFTRSEITLKRPVFYEPRPGGQPVKEVVHTTSSTVRVPPRPQADWHSIFAEDRE